MHGVIKCESLINRSIRLTDGYYRQVGIHTTLKLVNYSRKDKDCRLSVRGLQHIQQTRSSGNQA